MGKPNKNKKSKEENVIKGLAGIVGLDESASNYEVLKMVAETLGCTVAEDGTTTIEEEEEEGEEPAPKAKRPRKGAGAEESAAGDDGSDEELGEVDSSGSEGGSGDLSLLDEQATMAVEPIKVKDPRQPGEVQKQEEIVDGEALFQWLISPVDIETFDEAIEEQNPLLVSRPHNRAYYNGLFSKDEINRLLKAQKLQYQLNIDVVSYQGGCRETWNFNGKEQGQGEPEWADASVVWRRFEKEACSIRVLHPQRYSDALWRVLSRLEGFLQCCVGCNAYLTPGFAPHWDDVDVYIIQIEGKKRWRLYAPTEPAHVLPRYPSRDFTDEELGDCVLHEVLEPGDLLYLPRGTVHQGVALEGSHSLHLTISTNQLRTWADFLEQALPRAVQLAAADNVVLRRSLPRNFPDFVGLVYESSDEEEEEGEEEEGKGGEPSPAAALKAMRAAFREEVEGCMEVVSRCLPLDSTADQMALQFIKARLPPVLPPGTGAPSEAKPPKLSPESRVRLVQPGVARLIVEDEPEGGSAVVVYHCLANSRQQHASRPAGEGVEGTGGATEAQQRGAGKALAGEEKEEEEQEEPAGLEFPIECAPLVEAFLDPSNEEITLSEVPPCGDCELQPLEVAQALADAGLLVLAP